MSETLSEIEGKYEILEKLQVGGMGAIYKVRHRLLGDDRVVKVMRPQLMHDPELRHRFHREARAATRLIHPNIARLYDFSIDEDGNAYIVMEFIRGWTLDELIARGELPPLGLALEIADQSLKAIGHLHAHGVIHRDISPDNLMLTRDVDGRAAVKLIDLGLIKSSATSGNLTATGVFVGKFRYASPEQFGHGGTPGPPSDLYSFGLVLYELLTGRYPIAGKSASSLIAGHLFRPPLDFVATDLEGRVPEELRRAVMRALAKEPAERYPSAAAFAAALAPIGRRHALDGDATRRILELISEPPSRLRPRLPTRGSTQSRFDRHFAPEPTPSPDAESVAAADEGPRSWVRRIEAKIAANDFAAAREELRHAVEAEGETPELREIGERIAVIEKITAPPAPPPPPPPPPAASLAREAEAELVEVEALRAAGRLEQALDRARDLALRAPRHKLIRLVVVELEREIAAARQAGARQPGARQPGAPDAAGPTELLRGLRSQIDKELDAPADARRQARRQADELVARARERAAVEDFAAAREELRRALELWPGHPEGLVLQVSVDACLQVREEEARSEEELESTLRDIRDLVAAGKTGSALQGLEEAAFRFGEREELRALEEEALRMEGEEGEEEDEAARAMTTLLETRADDAAALAKTELLPQSRTAAAPSPVGPPPPEPPPPQPPPPQPPPPQPPPSAAPTAVLRRRFDEISLKIPQQPRPGKAADFDVGDLTLASAAAVGPLSRSRTGRRTFLTAVVVVAVFLAIGLGLSGVLPWPGQERTESGVEDGELTVGRLVHGLDTAPSAPLRAAAEAYLAEDFETLAATAAGSFAGPREEAWAHLLRAAACHALYVRGGEEDPALRERTLEEIRASRAADAGVVPGDGFSPSFLDLVASTR